MRREDGFGEVIMTQSEFRKKRKSAGVCVQCGREDAFTMVGRSLCDRCAAMARESNSRWYIKNSEKILSDRTKLKESRKANGLCPVCGKPANDGFVMCGPCRKKRSDYRKRHRIRVPRGECGVCYRCNKKEAISGKRMCLECYEKAVETAIKNLRAVKKEQKPF